MSREIHLIREALLKEFHVRNIGLSSNLVGRRNYD